MAIKVLELELNSSDDCFEGLDLSNYSDVQILVRYNSVPINYAWFKLYPGQATLNLNQVRLEIMQQLQWPLMRTLLQSGLEGIQKSSHTEIPAVTVVIPTRNRAVSLERTLHSLARLNYPCEKLEVLVVDNAPIDNASQQVVARFPQFHYVLEPRPGLEWARNRGLLEAKGEIVAYTDDDVEVDAGWLKALANQFADPAVMAVTGLVAPAQRDSEAQNIFEEFGGFGRGFERRYYAKPLEKIWPFPLNAGIFGVGANMAFRKEVLRELKGFDPILGAGSVIGSGGDLDLFYRLARKGHLLVYEPRALVWHYHRADLEALQRQLQNYGSGVYGIFTKAFVKDPAMRTKVLTFGVQWFFQNFLLNMLRQEGTRRKLMGLQAKGALTGLVRYRRSVRRRQELEAQYGHLDVRS